MCKEIYLLLIINIYIKIKSNKISAPVTLDLRPDVQK